MIKLNVLLNTTLLVYPGLGPAVHWFVHSTGLVGPQFGTGVGSKRSGGVVAESPVIRPGCYSRSQYRSQKE